MKALDVIALPILATRHATAVLLGFVGELLSSVGNSLGAAARKLDGNF